MTKWQMMFKIVSKWYQKSVDTGDPLVRVLLLSLKLGGGTKQTDNLREKKIKNISSYYNKKKTWRGDKTNRQFEKKKLKDFKLQLQRKSMIKITHFHVKLNDLQAWSIKFLLINEYIPTNANVIERINWILFMCDK